MKKVKWICLECGIKHHKQKESVSTFHLGKCDVCGMIRVVTEGRDFGVYEVKK
jgi:hypothetical protein